MVIKQVVILVGAIDMIDISFLIHVIILHKRYRSRSLVFLQQVHLNKLLTFLKHGFRITLIALSQPVSLKQKAALINTLEIFLFKQLMF